MKIELRSIERIQPYEQNPRVNDDGVEAVARSIQTFGWRQPIVVDKDGIVVAGHTRLKAARQLGMETVPVHVASDLTPEQAKAYRLADNATATWSDWDYDQLQIELADLRALDFDMETLGFTPEELEELLAPIGDGVDAEDDEIPEPPEVPDSKPGEIYELGPHRLMVGDATNREDVLRLMDGEQADLLLTDPPYGVAYVGKTKDALTIENDAMDDESYRSFLVSALSNADAVMKTGASFYIWHADSKGLIVRGACEQVGWPVRQCLIWAKNVMVMGRQDYHWKHEPCLYGWKPGAAHQWLSDRCQTTVLEFDRPSRSEAHPTMKPVALFQYLMANSCKREQIVFDPFAGSGTTLVAAERSGRAARLLELDPRYADVIRERWAANGLSATARTD